MPDQTRKLAAIVFTDIVGFTKLSAVNEPAALSLLETQRELLKPIVEKHGGSWLKEIGDGLLLSFETTKDAVDCAIEIQKIVKEVENLNLRIGIHQGEVVFQGGDVIGDDVNIAARIEPFAAPGGVAISGRVNASLERDPVFQTHYLGQPQLKGVSQSVKAYCITSHGLPKTDMSKVNAKLEPDGFQWNVKNTIGIAASTIGLFMLINFMFLRIGYADKDETPSIAILPFENRGAEADEFFAYGISSDLIADVTGTGMIRVAGLNDIERLDYASMSYNDLSEELLVRYVAKGTLWKMDTMFQLSMELFDTKNSEVVWSNRWQTAWKDLAIIKDDLADKILENLNINVIKNIEQANLITNSEAYEYYLKGKYKFDKRVTSEDLEIAKGFYQKAIELDSTLIKARTGLASTYAYQSNYDRWEEICNNLLTYSEQVNNKEGIALALYGLGSMVSFRDNDYDKSMEYYERALIIAEEIDLLLLKTKLLNNMSIIYNYRGEKDKSLSTIKEQAKLSERLGDKKSQIYALMGLASIYGEDDPDKAYEYQKEALQLSKKIGNKNAEGLLLRSIARYFMDQKKDYTKALEYAKISRDIFKKLDDKEYEANSLDFVGEVYIELGDYESALDCANQSLDLNKDIDHEPGIFYSTLKVGFLLYKYGKDYNKALEYFSRASKKLEEENTPPIYTLTYISYISAYYQYIGDYDSAIENRNRAQNISEEINNINWEINILQKLGFLYTNMGENDKGFEHFRQAKEKSDAMNFSKTELAQNLMNIGWVYLTKGDYKIAAEQYLDKALELKKETGDDLGLWGSLCLYLSYKHLGKDYDLAHIRKLIDEENNIDFETNYMIYQLLGERPYLKTAYDQVKEREDVLDTKLREKFYNYPTPKAIIEEWQMNQS